MAASAAMSSAIPSRIRRGLSRKGRRSTPAAGRNGRGGSAGRAPRIVVMAREECLRRASVGEERELHLPHDVVAGPRPDERRGPRTLRGADAHVVFAVALERAAVEE